MAVARKTKKAKRAAVAASYDRFKKFKGKTYTGMAIGRSHKWYYDKGEWKETKITPDLWRISYAVTKRRAGKAPKGSGAAIGTGYQWYILAYQQVVKLNEDDYTTAMTGIKYKLAHRRAKDGSWSASAATQRKGLIGLLRQWIRQLEKEAWAFKLDWKDQAYKGEFIPLPESSIDGMPRMLDVMLNGNHIGVLRWLKSGWKIDEEKDRKLVKALGALVEEHYTN
jgi:hypothetical protein